MSEGSPARRLRAAVVGIGVAIAAALGAASCAERPARAATTDDRGAQAGGASSGASSGAAYGAEVAPSAEALRATSAYRAGLDTLAAALDGLARAVEVPLVDASRVEAARARFADARGAFKRVEGAMETVAPSAAGELNGPALPEVEEEEGMREAVPPKGLQVVEAMLWPEPDPAAHDELRGAVGIVRATVERVRKYATVAPLADRQVFDAARQELARVSVLGLAGFDSPVALRALPEAADAVAGVRALLAPYAARAAHATPRAWAVLAATLDSAERELRAAGASVRAFEGFDRLRFVVARANPAARALSEVRLALGVPLPAERRAWRAEAATLFERGALDPQAFAPAWAPASDARLVALGRELFADARLSADGTRSCASCHAPSLAFTDGRARSAALARVTGARLRNAPTLLNAALQPAQFSDFRASFLEDQVALVVRDTLEMHGSLDEAAARLRADPVAAARFRAALGGTAGSDARAAARGSRAAPQDAVPTERDLRAAIAAYLRTLVALDSRVDRALRGDTLALTADERRGFTVFMGKGKCGTCHFAPLFNGTVPPAYRKAESEVLGVPATVAWRDARVDPDVGRHATFDAPVWKHAFKTPTVRNAALTAPYMHNGVYRTLDEVVEFYDRGGGAGIGIELPNQTLPPEPLRLTRAEKRQLVAFMRALTDSTSAPLR